MVTPNRSSATLAPSATSWVDEVRAHYSAPAHALIAQAAQLHATSRVSDAEQAHHARALQAAGLLATLGMDPSIVCATLLESVELSPEQIAEQFGADMTGLVIALRRVRSLDTLLEDFGAESTSDKPTQRAARLETLRKMVLALAQDARVVAAKLAHHLCELRGAGALPENERARLVQATADLFAPLANRLGMWQIKWELEDLALRYREPDTYKQIARLLDERRVDRERYITQLIATLQAALAQARIDGEVSGRPKHIYSIYKKMQRKAVSFDQLYDVRALRVLVPEVKDCYTVLGIVHDLWQPIAGEFDDYIAHPKDNAYRSLHTAVTGPEGKAVEVQIRTFDMHREAELGFAAHWRYKESGRVDRGFDQTVLWLRQLLDWKQELAQQPGYAASAARGVFDEHVFVLTPQGKIIDLPKGATPVDFAYLVHTELGHRCRGAKVDGHIVPLTYQLQNAQRVEIVAAKQGGPSRDWLNPSLGYLHSGRAMAKARQWFKQQELEQDIAAGRAVLEKEVQRAGVPTPNQDQLAASLHFANTEELLAALGRGEITSRQLQLALAPPAPALAPRDDLAITQPIAAPAAGGGVLVLGINNIATLLARCCKPIPGEAIIGFVTKTRGVMVHKLGCENLRRLSADQAERLMPAQWGEKLSGRFPVDLAIEALDRQGLLRDISEVFTREKVNVTAVNTISRGAHAQMRFTVEISDLEHLQRLLSFVKTVSGVSSARRSVSAS